MSGGWGVFGGFGYIWWSLLFAAAAFLIPQRCPYAFPKLSYNYFTRSHTSIELELSSDTSFYSGYTRVKYVYSLRNFVSSDWFF